MSRKDFSLVESGYLVFSAVIFFIAIRERCRLITDNFSMISDDMQFLGEALWQIY